MAKRNENLVPIELFEKAKLGVDGAMGRQVLREADRPDKTTDKDPTKQPTKQPTTDKTSNLDPTKQPTFTQQPTIDPTLQPTQDPTLYTTDVRPDPRPDSLEEESLLLEKIDVIYPILHDIGFERSQIQDVIQSWKLNSIDLKDLPESLQRADYAVEHKSFKMNDPLNYVYSALMKGIFRKPPGYKSRAEIQAEERLAEQKQISEKNEEAFQLWCDNVSPDKRAELCKGIPRIKQSVHLREIFDNNKD